MGPPATPIAQAATRIITVAMEADATCTIGLPLMEPLALMSPVPVVSRYV